MISRVGRAEDPSGRPVGACHHLRVFPGAMGPRSHPGRGPHQSSRARSSLRPRLRSLRTTEAVLGPARSAPGAAPQLGLCPWGFQKAFLSRETEALN